MIIKAFAKINLTLDITGIIEGGYHSLRSVMVPISLYDEIELNKAENVNFHCDIQSICNDNNLCVKSAKAFLQKANISSGVDIKLKKNVPFPAGLGGGSADAAAVLKGLNELYGNPLSNEELFSLAAQLGSDVALCLLGKPALCEGRGEILTPLNGVPTFELVVAIGKARLSTPEVYKKYDTMNLAVKNDTDKFLSALEKGDEKAVISSIGNAFTPVANLLAPETETICQEMRSFGAKTSHLSGSGPSVYGIFETEIKAKEAAEMLKNKGYSAFVCKTLN